MHIEFDIEGSKMRYDAGDHLAMYPVNDEELVNKLGKITGTNFDTVNIFSKTSCPKIAQGCCYKLLFMFQVFSLINTDTDSSKKHPFPCPTTYRTALTHYLEITAIPRTHVSTHVLKELSEYCSDEKVYTSYTHLLPFALTLS